MVDVPENREGTTDLPDNWHRNNRATHMEEKLGKLVQRLDLSEEVHEKARDLMERIASKKLNRGWEDNVFVSSVVYISARNKDEPRSLKEVGEVLNSDKRLIGRCYRRIRRGLNLKVSPINARNYIRRYGKELMLRANVIKKALDIFERAKNEGLTYGKGKRGTAGACLYLASNFLDERRTQKDISQVIGTSDVTVRTRYKKIAKGLGIEDKLELDRWRSAKKSR